MTTVSVIYLFSVLTIPINTHADATPMYFQAGPFATKVLCEKIRSQINRKDLVVTSECFESPVVK